MKIAVYDIGTNSIHLLIVKIHKDLSFEILDHEKDTTRLGGGSFAEGRLSAKAIKRGLDVIGRFARIADKSGIRKSVAVATSAVREAENGGEFIEAVYRRTGIRVRIITGEEEGRLVFLAACSSVETLGEKTLVIDIGGGSMELILGDNRRTYFLESYPLGVARMTDRFIRRDPPSKKELKRLEDFLYTKLKKPARNIRRIGFEQVIGTAGSLINLASMVSHEVYSRPLSSVNQFELCLEDLETVHRAIIRTKCKERMMLPGLDPKRADLIVAGSILTKVLMRLLKTKKITLSDRAIREGVVIDYIEKNRKRIRQEPEVLSVRERSVFTLARRLGADDAHARQVCRLALMLFDRTWRLHRLGDCERQLLRFAASLHDIGYYVSFRKHHKHSYYLIAHSELSGFSPEEIEAMARIAMYHRKPVPRVPEAHVVKIRKSDWHIIRVLAAILRIADALDRSHFSVVKCLSCRIGRKRVMIRLKARGDVSLEIWQAGKRKDLFEELFKRKVVFERSASKAKRL